MPITFLFILRNKSDKWGILSPYKRKELYFFLNDCRPTCDLFSCLFTTCPWLHPRFVGVKKVHEVKIREATVRIHKGWWPDTDIKITNSFDFRTGFPYFCRIQEAVKSRLCIHTECTSLSSDKMKSNDTKTCKG